MSWIFYALLAALCFGLRGVLYQWTSQKTMSRNLMLCGVFFTGLVVSFFFLLFQQTPIDPSASQILIGASMGVLSFAANASLYKGYAVGKASLVSVLASLPPLIVVILAFLLWVKPSRPFSFGLSLLSLLAFT